MREAGHEGWCALEQRVGAGDLEHDPHDSFVLGANWLPQLAGGVIAEQLEVSRGDPEVALE